MSGTNSSGKISDFYAKFPFPNIQINTQKDIDNTLIFRLIYGLTRKYIEKCNGKKLRVLDVGCGTGELDLGLAKLNMEITGVDINKESINIAKKRAKKFNAKNINFRQLDFTKGNLRKAYYDFVFSIGVLHHLNNPEKNFVKLIKSLKIGGYIVIGIYNPYGSFKVRIKRGILKLLAGDNFKKKIEIYRKLFYRRPLTTTEEVSVADAFANPYRRYYTFEQLLEWFNKNNIEYLDSVPPLEIVKNLRLIKEMTSNILFRKGKNLMDIWQEITYEILSKKWERSKIITFLTQLSWVPIGRGELINIVGRKKG